MQSSLILLLSGQFSELTADGHMCMHVIPSTPEKKNKTLIMQNVWKEL